ncbi:plasmid replication DNA-binding protein [Acinetobacter bohemicus]|mgnify:CR=1 FL=1|uniref:plasmid replication DNA-binding protein n=1 Tax=Acinetobacter bohemicus TaxID=1435036 RepID=UPI003FA1F526
MKALSVIELAKLYGMTRQSIYKRIQKGDLSKNSNGKIDLSEAIRVFGEPSQRVNQLQTTNTQKLSEVHILEQQVHMLQKQLEIAQDREQFQREELKAKNGQLQAKDDQIESLQRLLGAPKSKSQMEKEPTPEPIQPIPQLIPEPQPIVKESQPEPKQRRGLFGRLIRAVLD